MRTGGIMVAWLFAAGCGLKLPPFTRTAEPVPAPAPAPPVSFVPLEQRLDTLIAETDDTDRRDRLVQLRELAYAMRGQDPAVQARVFRYMEAAIAIEERSRTMGLPDPETVVPIEGTDLGAEIGPAAPGLPPAQSVDRTSILAAARAAFAAGRYQEAIETVGQLGDADALALRREAVDAFARAERERAGTLFLTARGLPSGPARSAGLAEAARVLRSVNEAYPDNSFAAAITENLAQVEAEGARP